jgi:DNA-binding MarR family transcriptional regulator
VTSAASPNPAATRVWTSLQSFVDAYDRRKDLQEVLGLGRGLGRIRLLLFLLSGPATLRDIAEAGAMDAPYATVIVDKLEGLGLVERTAHPDDHRRKLVQLTPAGSEATRLASEILAEPPEVLRELPSGDLAYLEEILARLATGPQA